MKNLILFLFFSIVTFGAQAQTTVECFSGKQYINCTTCAEGDETGYGYGVQFVDGTDTFRIFAPITYKAYELYAGAGRKVMFYGQSQTRSILYKSYFLSQLDVASEDALVAILDGCNGVSGGTGGGGGIECGDVTACVDFAALTPTQIIELSEAIDFNNLTPAQEADLCAKTSITVNAGTTATSTDNANGETIIDCNDVIHFWSDGTNNVNVTAGSAVIEVSVNISSDADNAIAQGLDGGVFVDGSQMIPSGGANGDVLTTDGAGNYLWQMVTATDDQTAIEVPYDNTTSGLTATDVQSALDELQAKSGLELYYGTLLNSANGHKGIRKESLGFESFVGLDTTFSFPLMSVYDAGENYHSYLKVTEVGTEIQNTEDYVNRFIPSANTLRNQTRHVMTRGRHEIISGFADTDSHKLTIDRTSGATFDVGATGLVKYDEPQTFTSPLSIITKQYADDLAALDLDQDPTNEIQDAVEVPYDNTASGATATDVQSVIDEVIATQALDLDIDPTNEIELPIGGGVGDLLSTDGAGNYTWTTVSVSDDQTASEVVYDGTASGLTATDVQSAIDEVAATQALDLDIDPTNEIQDASQVTYDNTTSGATATSVQDAIDEVLAAQALDLDIDPTNEIELPTGGASGDVLETDGLGGYTWVTPSVGNTSTMTTTGTNGFTHDDGTGTTYAVTIDTIDGGAIDTLVFDLGGTLFEVPFVDEFEVATKTVAFNEVVGNDELITLAQDEVFWFAPKDITITSVSYGFETAPTDVLAINLDVGTTEFATTIVAADQYEKVSGSVVVTEGTPIRFISAVPTSGNWEGMHITIEYTEN